MDNVSDIEEIMSEVFVYIKEVYSFLEIVDLDIYKLIRKNVGKNRTITKEELLKKVNNYYSKLLVKSISDDIYDDMDKFFENSFVCLKKDDSLKKLSDLLASVSGKLERELYIKLFRRYEILSNTLVDILEEYDYSMVKIKKGVFDNRILSIVCTFFEFSGSINQNKTSDDCCIEVDVYDGIINDYYLNHDINTLEEIIDMHMPLIKSLAIKYQGKGLDYDDLVQEGVVGFLKAIDKFHPDGRSKLSSYAYPSIKRHMVRAINSDSRNIRIPDWRCEELKKYVLEKCNFIVTFGVEPTLEQMASLLNISLEKVYESEVLSFDYISSLNFKVDEDSETELGDILEDTNYVSPESIVIENSIREDIDFVLEEVLTNQEKAVIDLAFGRYDGVVRNNAEVGKVIYEYGLYPKPLTRERVRQLRSGAIKKLQDSSYVKKLESYY